MKKLYLSLVFIIVTANASPILAVGAESSLRSSDGTLGPSGAAIIKQTETYDPDSEYSAYGCTTTGSDQLDSHRLPAAKGGSAREQHLSVEPDDGDIDKHYGLTNTPQSDRNGFAVGKARPRGALPTNDPKLEQYYITMRWRYAIWAWNGTSDRGPEDVAFYRKNPRVLVTNPRTGKSLVAAAIEAGPAPWTGTSEGRNNTPSYWQGKIDGTPPEYKGRVSGLSPEAFRYLEVAPRMADGSGDDLVYSWAPDQTAIGPTNVVAKGSDDASACGASGASFIKRIEFSGKTITPTAIVLHWTGAKPDVETTINALKGNKACGSEGCSVQLTIDGEGKVYQLTDPLNSYTEHAAGINSNSIGIEIGGRGEDDLLNNAQQKEAVITAVIQLMHQFNIQFEAKVEDRKGLLAHFETDKASYSGGGSGKPDPGRKYMQEIRDEVKKRLEQ